jgi:hypothetical protein
VPEQTAVERQRPSEHVFLATYTHQILEKSEMWYFPCGPSQDYIYRLYIYIYIYIYVSQSSEPQRHYLGGWELSEALFELVDEVGTRCLLQNSKSDSSTRKDSSHYIRFERYKNPVRTSQETHIFAIELRRLMLCKI